MGTVFVLVFAILAGGSLLGHVADARPRTVTGEAPAEQRPTRGKAVPPDGWKLSAPPLRVVPETGPRRPAQPPQVAPETGPRRPAQPAQAVPETVPGRPPLPLEQGGPFGSRLTTGTPEVALTFDDGPHPQWTPQVLALLAQYHVTATFCLIGVNAAKYPELVRAIVAGGHTLCNHSWSHDMSLGQRDEQRVLDDLRRTNAAIRAAVPQARISYFRQPGGRWSKRVVAAAQQLGMTPLHWRVDPRDWKQVPSNGIANLVTTQATAGSIVLLHDGGGDRRRTLAALRVILPNLLTRFHLGALPPGRDAPPEHDAPRVPGSTDPNARGDGERKAGD
jgi:peptidoglycan/xylan/chitin deacetylase (PgdA/CDA1 family)